MCRAFKESSTGVDNVDGPGINTNGYFNFYIPKDLTVLNNSVPLHFKVKKGLKSIFYNLCNSISYLCIKSWTDVRKYLLYCRDRRSDLLC